MWRRLTHEGVQPFLNREDKVVVARRGDGKCCVGHVIQLTDRNVVIRNGDYETTLWLTEPRMFYTMSVPIGIPDVRMGEAELKFGS